MNTPPFEVGDRVTSDYYVDARYIIRVVTKVAPLKGYASGWAVSADAGEPCLQCGRYYTDAMFFIDSGWFKKVEED